MYLNKIIQPKEDAFIMEMANSDTTAKAGELDFENQAVRAQRTFLTELNFGLSISNIGPKIWFQDKGQADPAPTNMKFGIYSTLWNDEYNKRWFLNLFESALLDPHILDIKVNNDIECKLNTTDRQADVASMPYISTLIQGKKQQVSKLFQLDQ